MLFYIVNCFTDHADGLAKRVPMKSLNTRYLDLVWSLTAYKRGGSTYDVQLGKLRRQVKKFKILLKTIVGENCEAELYTLKFHLLDHEVGASPSEMLNAYMKQAYRTRSQLKTSSVEETGDVTDARKNERLKRDYGTRKVELSLKLQIR